MLCDHGWEHKRLPQWYEHQIFLQDFLFLPKDQPEIRKLGGHLLWHRYYEVIWLLGLHRLNLWPFDHQANLLDKNGSTTSFSRKNTATKYLKKINYNYLSLVLTLRNLSTEIWKLWQWLQPKVIVFQLIYELFSKPKGNSIDFQALQNANNSNKTMLQVQLNWYSN